MKRFKVLTFVCVLTIVSIGACAIFNKIDRPSPPAEDVSLIIKREQAKMLEAARKNELEAEKEKELAIKTEEEKKLADIESITTLLVSSGWDKLPAEKIFEKGEEFYVKALGIDKRRNVFAIRLILPAEPKEIHSRWWSPQIKSKLEFEEGLYFLNERKLDEKAFSFIFLADLEKIEFDQFVVVLSYIHPLSGIKYSHQVPVSKNTPETKSSAK